MSASFLDALASKYIPSKDLSTLHPSPNSSPPSPSLSSSSQPKTNRFYVHLATPSTIIDYSNRSFAPSLPPASENESEKKQALKSSIEKSVKSFLITVEDNSNKKQDLENYDYEDPFIDDSEFFIEDLDHVAPKTTGFFVYKGPLKKITETNSNYYSSDAFEATSSRKRKAKLQSSSDSKVSPKKPKKKKLCSDSKKTANDKTEKKTNTATSSSEDPNESKNKAKTKQIEHSKKEPDTPPNGIVTTGEKKSTSKKVKKVQKTEHKSSSKEGENSKEKPKESNSKKNVEAPKQQPKHKEDTVISTPQKTKKSPEKEEKKIKRKKKTKLFDLPGEVMIHLKELKVESSKESFEGMTKFPSYLRKILHKALRESDLVDNDDPSAVDNFIAHLQDCIPFNSFTCAKLINLYVFPQKIDICKECSTRSEWRLKERVNEMMKISIAEYEESLKQLSTNGSLKDDSADKSVPQDSNIGKDSTHMTKRYKWTPDVRKLVYDIITSELKIKSMIARLKEYNKEKYSFSEASTRKNLYQKLLVLWPSEWMTSEKIGREYSSYKRKIEKHQQSPSKSPNKASESEIKSAKKSDSFYSFESKDISQSEHLETETTTQNSQSPSIKRESSIAISGAIKKVKKESE